MVSQKQTRNLCRLGIRVAKWTACAVVLFLVGKHVAMHWPSVTAVRAPQWGWIVAGSAVAVMGWSANVWVYRGIVRSHGFRVSFAKVAGLYLVPMLGKYVPGKVWSVLGSVWLFGRGGIPKSVAVTCVGLNTVLSLTSAVLISLAASVGREVPLVGRLLMVLVALLLLVGIHPKILYRCVNWGLRRLRRDEIVSSLGFGALLKLLAGRAMAWALFGVGFYCVIRSFAFAPARVAPEIVGLFIFAQIAGFVALFAPAGLGVREGVLIVGLTPLVGSGPAIVISGLCRLWQTGLELVVIAFGWAGLRCGDGKVVSDSVEERCVINLGSNKSGKSGVKP